MTHWAQFAYALLWISFGAIHSLLAGSTVRGRVGRVFGRWHQIAYDLISARHIVAVYAVGRLVLAREAPNWPLLWPLAWLVNAIGIVGASVALVACSEYRLASFAGFAQVAGNDESVNEGLSVTGRHRFVRHSLCTGILLILWSGARSDFELATAFWGTLYILISSRIKARRLLARFSQSCAPYRRHAPALLLWRIARRSM